MSYAEVPVTGVVPHSHVLSILISAAFFYLLSFLVSRIHTAFFGPLSKFPGPKIRAFSILPWAKCIWNGDDSVDFPALHQEYGEVVRIGPNHLSFVGDAQVWKDIYGFRKAGQREAVKDPVFYGETVNRVPGLITADGPTHSRQRKIVSHAFSDKALKEQQPMLKQWANKLLTKLKEQALSGQSSDMVMMFNCTTFDIMGDLTFAEPLYMLEQSSYVPWVRTIFANVKFGAGVRALRMFNNVFKRLLEEVLFRMPTLRKKQMEHWKYTTDRVDRRLSSEPDRPDLWSRILEKSEGPGGLSLQEHYSIASLFMVAGTETTATALSGTLYQLLQNPEYMSRLQRELRQEFSDTEELLLEPLARQAYLEAVLKEGIRMYPPVPTGLPRIAPLGGMKVGDYYVPEGTKVQVHQLSTYRQPTNFKDADQFRPERWLGDPEYANDKGDSFEPFSVGPRNCLGKNLAWHELRLLLSTVLLNFDVELCKKSQHWTDQKIFTLWEKKPLMCQLTPVKQ